MAAAFEFVRVKSLSLKSTGASSTDVVIHICAEHNLRQGHCHSRDKQSGAIDPARSDLNVTMRGCDTAAAVAKMARDLVRVGDWQKPYQRANAAVGAELVFSLPANTLLDVIAYFRACVEWAEQFFDAPALSATIHLDQRQPHVHLIFLAVRGGQWRGGRFFGNRDAINAMHAAFHAAVGKPYGLRRQQQSSESAAIRYVTAAREFDAIMAHQGLMNVPAVRQALVSLIAADPERLRAAREQAMSAGGLSIALPGGDAPEGEKQMFYPVIAHFDNDASITTENVVDDGQDALVHSLHQHEQHAALRADLTPQPDTPAPIRIDIRTGSLAGEACLTLPTYQLTATCVASAAPQPSVGGVRVLLQAVCSDKPAGRVYEQPTMFTPIHGDQDEPTERVTRERDADYAASLWDEERGEFIKLQPATPPSRQAQARKEVHDALTNLTRVSSKQSIRSP